VDGWHDRYPRGTFKQRHRHELDTTTWTYDDNTGWLVAKSDAANTMVTYDYEFSADYRNVIEHSARDPGHPTTRCYGVETGDLLKIDYTDGTTDNPGTHATLDQLRDVEWFQKLVFVTRTRPSCCARGRKRWPRVLPPNGRICALKQPTLIASD